MNKKLVGLLIVLGALVVFLFIINSNLKELTTDEDANMEATEHSDEYYNIMNMDFEYDYPKEYLDVIDANTEIVLYEYGEDIQEYELDDIISKQRELFATDLTGLNTLEEQEASYLEEVKSFRAMDRYILGRQTLTSQLVAYDGSVAEVLVDEYYNDGLILQYTYYLTIEDGKWKIFSWDREVTETSTNAIVPEETN